MWTQSDRSCFADANPIATLHILQPAPKTRHATAHCTHSLPRRLYLLMTFPTTIYARWIHRHNTPSAMSPSKLIFYYEVPVCPCAPLRPGLRAKVLLLVNARFHEHGVRPMNDTTPIYDTYEQWVEGSLQMAGLLPTGAVTFILENECDRSPIHFAHISIPIIHGYTTDICSFTTPTNTTLTSFIPPPLFNCRGKSQLRKT